VLRFHVAFGDREGGPRDAARPRYLFQIGGGNTTNWRGLGNRRAAAPPTGGWGVLPQAFQRRPSTAPGQESDYRP